MGILDAFNSDEGMQGLGLLAAAAPSMAPMNLAGRLAQAGQNYQALQSGLMERGLKKAQLDEALQKTALEKFSLQRLQDWQKLLMDEGGGSAAGQQPLVQTAPAGATTTQPQLMGPPSQPQPFSIGAEVSQSLPTPTQQAPTQPGFAFALPGVGDRQSRAIAGSMTPGDYMKMYADKASPQTDITKLLATQGIDPKSALGQILVQQAITKANYIAPANIRPGGYTQDAAGNVQQFPHVPEGSTAFKGPDGQFHIVPLSGGLPAVQAAAAAQASGKAGVKPTIKYINGVPQFSTELLDAQRANGILPPAQAATSNFTGPPEKTAADIAQIKDLQERANATAAFEAQARRDPSFAGRQELVTPVPLLGAVEGAKLSQDELSSKGKQLGGDSSNAQTVISRLQNIKILAPGSINGAETSKRDFFNGLLSLGGIKGAVDAKTASDLVDKNSAQIVAAMRLGAGGGGTDALQALLGSGNPSRKMTLPAINDAVDQLIASQKMTQAKYQLLQSHYLGRDPVAYGTKENTFDQHADPRIWQIEGLKGQAQADYIKSLPPEVASEMIAKRKALKDIGALK